MIWFDFFRNKKQERKDLSHELKHAAQVIQRLTNECNKLMVEKFGKLVQLEKLEGAIVNLQIEELKQRLDDAGDEYYNTMAQYEVKKWIYNFKMYFLNTHFAFSVFFEIIIKKNI